MRRPYASAAVAALLALAATVSFTSITRADDPATGPATAPATGTIKGTVTKTDGSEFDGTALVGVYLPPPPRPTDGSATTPPAPRTRPKAIKTYKLKPDDKGVFTLTVPVGDYRVMVVDQVDKLSGYAMATVTDGQEDDISITLKARKARGGGGGAGAGGGGGGAGGGTPPPPAPN